MCDWRLRILDYPEHKRKLTAEGHEGSEIRNRQSHNTPSK